MSGHFVGDAPDLELHLKLYGRKIGEVFDLAPRAGFEPATNRLTAGCSTAELPGKSLLASSAYNKAGRALKAKKLASARQPALRLRRLEATPGIEPG
jgi:hypothetical protein